MYCNIYATDFGEVRLSQHEADILALAQDIRRELSGTPFASQLPAANILKKAHAIEDACKRTAYYKWMRRDG